MTAAAVAEKVPAPAPPGDFARRVGRYTLYKAISKGGTATVHFGRLHGESGFARPVAIKRLLSGFSSDPDLVAMLIDEARIAGRIQHPNVVQIIDVVQDDGEPLLVMEYVHGTSLSHLLRLLVQARDRVPPRVACAIAVDALRGLHAAHEAHDETGTALEIVHRDVSPQNILLDVSGIARVADFGVAKARGRLQRTTETGSLKGKIGYLAPEQIHGNVSRQSDLFSLGIVLWEMLVGTRLFVGESEGAILALTLTARVDAPSKRGAQCTPALDAVVLKALDRDPAHRYATGAEMAEAITACGAVAPPSEVAAWLAGVAGSVFDERRRLLRELESGNGIVVPDLGPASVAPVAASDPGDHARASRRMPVIVGAGLVALLASFGLFYFLGAGPRDAAARAAEAPPASAVAPPSAPVEEVAPEAPALAATNASASANPSAPTPTRAQPRPIVRRSGARRPDCSVPYEVDAKGRKIWRRECF